MRIFQKMLEQMTQPQSERRVTVGFDGYIDSIMKVLAESGANGKKPFQTMDLFGAYIREKAGKSCSVELSMVQEKIGGNMPIYALALSRLGIPVTCVGALGYPQVHPLYRPLQESCQVYSAANPGTCQALEFDDGKLMLADNGEVEKLDFDLLVARIGLDNLCRISENSHFISLLNWSELMGSSSIWKGFLSQVFPKIEWKHPVEFFVDLSDCSHREAAEVLEMLDLLEQLSEYGHIFISLNQNEAETIARHLRLDFEDSEELIFGIHQRFPQLTVILHLTDRCLCISGERLIEVKNKFVECPVLLTGGGDNFNAGFSFAHLKGLDLGEALVVANGVSGYYVSHGYSPELSQLIPWLREHYKGCYEKRYERVLV